MIEDKDDAREDDKQPLGLKKTILSILWAYFGVRSGRGFERDTARGDPVMFILVGAAIAIVLLALVAVGVRVTLYFYGY